MMHQLISGMTCPEVEGKEGSSPKPNRLSSSVLPLERLPPQPVFQKPRMSENKFLDLTKEVLLATAELLRNETDVGILHSIKLPEKTEFDNFLPPPDGKCVTMVVRTDIHMAVFCLFRHLDTRIEVS
jgi:hypothetical protein